MLKFVPTSKDPFVKKVAFVQVMAWCLTGNKPFITWNNVDPYI